MLVKRLRHGPDICALQVFTFHFLLVVIVKPRYDWAGHI